MAEDDLLVTTSGAALSLLFFENVRSKGHQMGFLLGETVKYVLKSHTDADVQVETVKTHINVQAVLTCPVTVVLHDSIGKIKKEKLKEFVQDKNKEVIGWFQFRQNMALVPTLRDKILHKQLVSHFSGHNDSREDLFLMCLLTSSTNASKSTHTFKQVFLRHKRSNFEPIPLRINNLGDDASRHDGNDYKPAPFSRSTNKPDVFTKLLQSEYSHLDPTKVSGIEAVTIIQDKAEQYLNRVIQKVSESDREVAELEKQVRELKAKIFAQNLSKNSGANGSPDLINLSNDSERESGDFKNVKILNDRMPTKMDSASKICDETRLRKDYTTSASQTMTIQKSRDTASSLEKSIHQKIKNADMGMDAQYSPDEDIGNMSGDAKFDAAEIAISRDRQFQESFCGISGQSICKKEQNGAGRGSTLPNFNNLEYKRGKRTTTNTTLNTQHCNVKTNQLTEDDDSVSSPKQTPKCSYNPGVKKNFDHSRSRSETDSR